MAWRFADICGVDHCASYFRVHRMLLVSFDKEVYPDETECCEESILLDPVLHLSYCWGAHDAFGLERNPYGELVWEGYGHCDLRHCHRNNILPDLVYTAISLDEDYARRLDSKVVPCLPGTDASLAITSSADPNWLHETSNQGLLPGTPHTGGTRLHTDLRNTSTIDSNQERRVTRSRPRRRLDSSTTSSNTTQNAT